VPDTKMTEKIHTALAARELPPAEHYLDSGYPSAALVHEGPHRWGVTLVSPLLADQSRQARASAPAGSPRPRPTDRRTRLDPPGAGSRPARAPTPRPRGRRRQTHPTAQPQRPPGPTTSDQTTMPQPAGPYSTSSQRRAVWYHARAARLPDRTAYLGQLSRQLRRNMMGEASNTGVCAVHR